MQRNWIGRSVGAERRVPGRGARGRRHRRVHHAARHAVRRHLHGARARAPARRRDRPRPSGPQDSPFDVARASSASTSCPSEAVASYREFAAQKSELERQAEGREKTGVFTGAFAKNPTNGWNIPIFIADYVLMGYGTGAIMAVPAHDQRDFEFAREFDLPDRRRGAAARRLAARPRPRRRHAGRRVARGLRRRRRRHELGERRGVARRAADAPRRSRGSPSGWRRAAAAQPAVTYKLRDWLFSRQRYWGEPFPIVYDDDGRPVAAAGVDAAGRAARDHRLRAAHPRRRRHRRSPEPPLARADDWVQRRARPRRRRRSATAARPTRCRSGPARAGTTCATSTPRTTTRSSIPTSSATGWGRRRARRRRRRPLRRWRRARGAAPPLRALLAQGALRPRPRVDARAVPPPLQPGHDHRRRVPRRARRVRRGARGRGARRLVVLRRTPRSCATTARWARA